MARRRNALLVLALSGCLGVSACGVKGPLEAPNSVSATPEGSKIIDGDTTEEKPRKRIVLDGLLE